MASMAFCAPAAALLSRRSSARALRTLGSVVGFCVAGLVFGTSLASAAPQSVDFSFSSEIIGGDNPGYVANSSVNFSWDDACSGAGPAFCTLTITLTANPTASGAAPSQGEVLSGVVFDVLGGADFRDGPPGNTPWGGSATASALEGAGAATALGEIGLDVSAHWGLNPAIAVPGRGTHALASVGDLFGGPLAGGATLGSGQRFPGTLSSVELDAPDGSRFGIIDSGSASGGGGWPSPLGTQVYVQDTVVATLLYEGNLTGVDNVVTLYGTQGLAIPEPSTGLLLGLGLLGLATQRRRGALG
jgi:hypothetical protein